MCQIGSQQPFSKDQLYDSFLLYLYHFKLNLKVVKSKIGAFRYNPTSQKVFNQSPSGQGNPNPNPQINSSYCLATSQ